MPYMTKPKKAVKKVTKRRPVKTPMRKPHSTSYVTSTRG